MAIIVIAILFQDVFAIGTDNWGYSWEILSYFEWREIRTSGTSLPLSADDEFFMIIYNDFPFYDRYYDTLFITSNGMVSFERGTRAYRNQALPADTVPPFIAPFWDDLSPQNGGGIAYLVDPDDSSLIVEWYDAPHYSSGGPYTFELILKKTGEIYFSYLNMNEPLNSATVGMQCNEHFLQLLMNGDPPENIPFDSLTLLIRRMRREIRVDTLLSPPELVRPSDIFYPSLKISNLSDIDTSAFAFIKITGLSGIPGYYDSILVNLSPHSSITAEFTNSWTPSSDSAYNITAWCSIEGDEIPSDDTLKKTVLSLTRGYWVLNSRDDGEIARFQWIEISGTGINSGLSGDDDVRQFEMLPFVFPFVDTAFTSLYISTNGFISFTDSRNDYNNQNFPSDIRNILAPFWDDLILNNPSSAIYIKHDTTENIFVVEWSDISHYGSSASYTFETILYPDGSFKYQYLRMSGVVNQSTIGYQYGLGETYYNSFLYNGAPAGHIPSDSFAIMYVPYTPFSRTDAAVVRVANNLSNITVGTICTLKVEVKNNSTNTLSFDVYGLVYRGEELLYRVSGNVRNLSPFITSVVPLFPDIHIPDEPDSFTAIFYTLLDGDMNPSNDTIRVSFRSTRSVFFEVVGNTGLTAIGGSTGSDYFAQGFTATGDTLFDAGISIYGAVSPYPDIQLEIWAAGADGYPDRTNVLYVGRRIDGRREISETARRYSVGLTEPIPLIRGNLYYIVINGTLTPAFSGYCGVLADLTNPYPYGAGYWSNDDGTTWTNSPFDELDMDFYIILSAPTFIKESEIPSKPALSAYPNPANENFTILVSSPKPKELVIYNIIGEIVWRKNVSAGISIIKPEITINSGLYFIKLGDSIIKRVVVIR